LKFSDFLKNEIDELKRKNLYRKRETLSENIINFSSNDYLGLRNNQYIKKLLCENIKNLSLGSGASTHISGYTTIQQNLEKKLAKFKKTEDCLVVGSGYLANVGLIAALTKPDDVIFSDELNHASIIDGIRLSKAKRVIYKHCDIVDLEKKIKDINPTKGRIFIVTDGVFSMEGDIAPIDRLYTLAKKYNAVLIIDDAHATGVIGDGRGSLFHFGLNPDENIIQMGTLSKAIGSYGAFICGTNLLVEYLINKMRTVIFTTALSDMQNFVSLKNLEIIEKNPNMTKELLEKAKFLYENIKDIPLKVKYYGVPIISIITKTEEKALYLRDKLLEHGYFVQAIRPPTVPKGESRLRITVSYSHTYEEIKDFIKTLKGVIK